jgi:hypothetical protein
MQRQGMIWHGMERKFMEMECHSMSCQGIVMAWKWHGMAWHSMDWKGMEMAWNDKA